MNKHDFYKELMSQYTFDQEKIRRNAKRASSASFLARNSKWLPLASAAAVFLIVLVGSVVLNGRQGSFIGGEDGDRSRGLPSAFISDQERFDAMTHMEELIISGNFEPVKANMYISFVKPLTYREAETALNLAASDTGAVEIVSFFSDGWVSAETAQSSGAFYTAVKVFAAKDLYIIIGNRAEFSAVEFDDLMNDENFQPISTTRTPDITELPVVTIPFVDDQTPPDSGNPSENPPVTGDTPNDVMNPPSTDNTPVITQPGTSDSPTQTTPPLVADPPNPPDEPAEPSEPPTMLEIAVSSAVSADFITENRLTVLTRNQVLLYEITRSGNRITSEIAQSFDTHNPKVTYTDMETGTLLIIGSDAFGRQTDFFIADGISGELRRLDTSNVTSGQTDISYAIYNNGEIILKAQSATTHAIYAAKRDGSSWFFERLEESEDRLIILGRTGGGFLYAQVSDNGETAIRRYNTARFNSEETDLGITLNNPRFERSPDAGNFAIITNDGMYIWNAAQSALIEFNAGFEHIRFHRYSGSVITDGAGRWFMLSGTDIVSTTEAAADTFAGKPSYSSAYNLREIAPMQVRIDVN